jgi:hypothetical protein
MWRPVGAVKKRQDLVQICPAQRQAAGRVVPCCADLEPMRILLSHLVFLAAIGGCSSVPTVYHPVHPLDPAQFSHDLFDQVVRSHVRDGRVAYPDVRKNGHFREYLAQLDRVDPAGLPTDRDRIAFWINAYNAFAIQGILDGYSPVTLWGRYRFFITRTYRVGGESLNLYDLERKILIPFRDPRIHFAIVCASQSCPKLQSWAYQGDRLDEQLDHVTRAFINDPSRNRFDRRRRIAYLSKIFDWYGEDFAHQAGSVQRFVARHLDDPELATEAATVPYAVEFLEYDWSLNGVPPGEEKHADSSS